MEIQSRIPEFPYLLFWRFIKPVEQPRQNLVAHLFLPFQEVFLSPERALGSFDNGIYGVYTATKMQMRGDVKHIWHILNDVPVALLPLLLFASLAGAADIGIGSGGRINVPLKSMKELRDQNLVRQRFDYSCGAAALATILRYGFGDEVTERDILVDLFKLLSENEKGLRRKEGFSLLDLQRVAQKRGYKAQGFRLAPEYLPRLRGPVIVFIEPRGYKHFAVLRGVKGDRIYLADPSRGNVRLPAYRFLHSWLREKGKGIIFVIEPKDGLPDNDFPLGLLPDGLPQPEIMTVREMLAVGNPFLRLPELAR